MPAIKITEDEYMAWMTSFRERAGSSPYEVLNMLPDPSPALRAEAMGAFHLGRIVKGAA